MGILDIFNGRIEYFNKIAVPIHNNIGSKINELPEELEKMFFALSLDLIAQKSIDLFFKPGTGKVLWDIKKYNQHDFERLYAVFMIWSFLNISVFYNSLQKSISKSKLQNILDLNEDEFNYYYKTFKHVKIDEL